MFQLRFQVILSVLVKSFYLSCLLRGCQIGWNYFMKIFILNSLLIFMTLIEAISLKFIKKLQDRFSSFFFICAYHTLKKNPVAVIHSHSSLPLSLKRNRVGKKSLQLERKSEILLQYQTSQDSQNIFVITVTVL